MATSFEGWGSSWAQTWERITDPNAMYGSVTITISATGTLTNAALPPAPPTSVGRGFIAEKPRKKRDDDEVLLLLM